VSVSPTPGPDTPHFLRAQIDDERVTNKKRQPEATSDYAPSHPIH